MPEKRISDSVNHCHSFGPKSTKPMGTAFFCVPIMAERKSPTISSWKLHGLHPLYAWSHVIYEDASTQCSQDTQHITANVPTPSPFICVVARRTMVTKMCCFWTSSTSWLGKKTEFQNRLGAYDWVLSVYNPTPLFES